MQSYLLASSPPRALTPSTAASLSFKKLSLTLIDTRSLHGEENITKLLESEKSKNGGPL